MESVESVESVESKGCDVKSRTNASAVLVRSFKFAQVWKTFCKLFSRGDSTVYRFLFLRPMSSSLLESEMSLNSENLETLQH